MQTPDGRSTIAAARRRTYLIERIEVQTAMENWWKIAVIVFVLMGIVALFRAFGH